MGQHNSCPLAAECRLRGFIHPAVGAFYHELAMITLNDRVAGNCGLATILELAAERPGSCSAKDTFKPIVA